ncbi:MAG: phage antirepressor N-terminal domain-containing protein [Candidatus Promineifilaceae bacterium]
MEIGGRLDSLRSNSRQSSPKEVTSVSVTLTQQAREMICLPLKFVPGWLFGINANRVKPEIRER